ncbi:MAG: ABC transporter substrate-binding protein [Pseudomonadota bacterium]
MRVVSHTCSNTEIVCALGCEAMLVGVDSDSDFPPDVVGALPQLGRDLNLELAPVLALKPDLVLTSRTLPGHDGIVRELEAAGLRTLVCEPLRLADVYADITRIAAALGVPDRGAALCAAMRTAMPPITPRAKRASVLVEWWPKPVIAPTRDSWVTDLIELAGGCNPFGERPGKSAPLTDAEIITAAPDAIVMSWCGVPLAKYRSEVVRRREGWKALTAVRENRIHAVTEAYLGRPGPRLVEGYRALCAIIEAVS